MSKTVNIDAEFPNGDPRAYGRVSIRLVAGTPGGSDGTRVLSDTRWVDLDANGQASVTLTANDDISPDDSYYEFTLEGSRPATVRNISLVAATADPVSWSATSIQITPATLTALAATKAYVDTEVATATAAASSGLVYVSAINTGTVAHTSDGSASTPKSITELTTPVWTATYTGHVLVESSSMNIALTTAGWALAVWVSTDAGAYAVHGQLGGEVAQTYQYVFPGYHYSPASTVVAVTEGSTYQAAVRSVHTGTSVAGTIGVGSYCLIRGL